MFHIPLQYFSYVMGIRFIDGGNQNVWKNNTALLTHKFVSIRPRKWTETDFTFDRHQLHR